MDLIDREDAINAIYHHIPYVSRKRATIILHEVQGMDLIRCKDCKNRYTDSCGMFDVEAEWEWTEDNGFCQYGERREE